MKRTHPIIIQGGMGAAVSGWELARAVSLTGQLGVVSGTALDAVLVRRLQLGDPDGHLRRGLAAFPIPGVADRILKRYYIPGGKAETTPFITKPMVSQHRSRGTEALIVAANFLEVYLAKEGHGNPVGINYLEKVQVPTLPSLYGAMLAGVEYVLMGAGIPRAIPGILDRLAEGLDVELKLDVKGAGPAEDACVRFSPRDFAGERVGRLPRPDFLAIVSTHVLAKVLATKASGEVNGFVVELPVAGGHNAPPRTKGRFNPAGEPLYDERDVPDLEAIAALGKPFWLAGGYAEPEQIRRALEAGAVGVQVGTAFAYCQESGFAPAVKETVLDRSRRHDITVSTEAAASPTGFPFKVVDLQGTLSELAVYDARERACDLGYLRQAYLREDGSIGWRCPAEPVEDYLQKGGEPAETAGRRCLCNALLANVGMPQITRTGGLEPMLITSGDDAATVSRFLPEGAGGYTAAEVVRYLLEEVTAEGQSGGR